MSLVVRGLMERFDGRVEMYERPSDKRRATNDDRLYGF